MDPSPQRTTITLLRSNMNLQKVTFHWCPCQKWFVILHKMKYLQINANFAVHFRVLKLLAGAEGETLQTWLDIIKMVNVSLDFSLDHKILTLSKFCYAQYLKRLEVLRKCYMCLHPEEQKLYIREFSLDFSRVACAGAKRSTQMVGVQLMKHGKGRKNIWLPFGVCSRFLFRVGTGGQLRSLPFLSVLPASAPR